LASILASDIRENVALVAGDDFAASKPTPYVGDCICRQKSYFRDIIMRVRLNLFTQVSAACHAGTLRDELRH
jgi:hypothetical protein